MFPSLPMMKRRFSDDLLINAETGGVVAEASDAEAAVAAAERFLIEARRDGAACEREISSAVSALCDALDSICRVLPASAIFRSVPDATLFLKICRSLHALEEAHRGAEQGMARLARYGERLGEGLGDVAVARKTVFFARESEEARAQWKARLEICEEALYTLAKRQRILRAPYGRLCFELIPRFLRAFSDAADLAAEGKNCNTTRLRELCLELRSAASRTGAKICEKTEN